MSSTVLKLMAVKKPAAVNKKFGVAMPARVVDLKTKVVDRRSQKIIARDEFIRKLKPAVMRVARPPRKPVIKHGRDDVAPADAAPADAEPADAEPADAAPADAAPADAAPADAVPEIKMKIIKKKKKRVKLKSASEEPVEKVGPPEKKFKSPIGVIKEGHVSSLIIGDESILGRLEKKRDLPKISTSPYYMNNRKIFINFMSKLFKNYKKEIIENEGKASCDYVGGESFSLMAHQKIVRDYINLYTPYRGLLLFHGLGSGKTCSSIAIAEGVKTSKSVLIMTPASLRMNYIEELKKCGDTMYRKNQYWEFIDTRANPSLIDTLSSVLSLTVEFIKKQGGAWLVNIKKKPNFSILSAENKASVDKQINVMIDHKYNFLNYNGMRMAHLKSLSENYTKNPFDNKIIIIDEAHNFVGRIVNKLTKKDSLSMKLYSYLMDAENTKIVFLTGTPMINYPNELGILFNILRGRIKTWSFKLKITDQKKITTDTFTKMFSSRVNGGKLVDFVEYKPTTTTLSITRNPFGFVNTEKGSVYNGTRVGESGNISDSSFIELITKVIKGHKMSVVPKSITLTKYNALPDTLEGFKTLFIDEKNNVKNTDLFKRRIMGLTSYFRSAQESLMPKYTRAKNFHVLRIPMSDFQYGVYEEARVQERKLELRNAKKRKKLGDGVFDDSVSTYRIFSRAFCNFVFPRPDIKRPMPNDTDDLEAAIINEEATEDVVDAKSALEKINDVDGKYERDEVDKQAAETDIETRSYQEKIKAALEQLKLNSSTYLSFSGLKTYSPKFLNMLENLQNPSHVGLHLVYSQFRTLEGIGILKLVLEHNGFAQFKVKQTAGVWSLNISEEDMSKPKFVLYTGTETAEEKEIVRNIFNGLWDVIPTTLVEPLKKMSPNNNLGEIIRIFMITASGAEGISLKNVRFVHITEPYWHPVRTEQVIGRARRICSHKDLPEDLQTVDVFLYLMTFTEDQLTSDKSIEMRLKDKGKLTDRALTSDEALFEISTIKEDIAHQLLDSVKESSIDCALHSKAGEEGEVKCFTFGTVQSAAYSFHPSIEEEETDKAAKQNKKKIKLNLNELTIDGEKYAYDKVTHKIYEYESYRRQNLVHLGEIEFLPDKKFRLVFI